LATPEQLHKALMYCADFAKTMLEDSGTFYPFGAEIRSDGQLHGIGGYNGEEHPVPTEIYKLLAEAFSSQAREGNILAAALAANVNIPAEYEPPCSDGIRVWLEGEGFARFIYFPYRMEKRGFFRKGFTVEMVEPIAVEITPGWFSSGGDA
jgi:hypothetical protein